jgi:hypothetical protein
LKVLIGQSRESDSSIEKALKPSTSNDVCERWDGEKVMREETKDPLIKELIYSDGEWYDLKRAEEKGVLTGTHRPKIDDAENGVTKDSHPVPSLPPNLSLNLSNNSYWELYAAAIFGISLQLLVLTIAGLTSFHPHWKETYPTQPYDFWCLAGGTLLLTCGLITCSLTVEQSTSENYYNTNLRDKVHVLWLQRGTSHSGQPDDSYILEVKRRGIRTSSKVSRYPSTTWKALTLAATLATALGYIIQFVGLSGMHWPTQASQFAITLMMTGVRALIRRAPQNPTIHSTSKDHELDWLVTNFAPLTGAGNDRALAWRIMTGEGLGKFEDPDLLSDKDVAALTGGSITIPTDEKASTVPQVTIAAAPPREKITTLPKGEKWLAQRVLIKRQDLGVLCRWTGPAHKWAMPLATAIDAVMNVLHPKVKLEAHFLWPLNVRVGDQKQRIFFKIKNDTDRWESNCSELEAALSLGLFGRDQGTVRGGGSKNSDEEDWFRGEVESVQRNKCITLLGPSTPATLRNLKWWLGPQNGKLKEITLHKDKDGKLLNIKQQRPNAFEDSAYQNEMYLCETYLSTVGHPIAGFESSWQSNSQHDSEPHNNDSPVSSTCLAAVSEVDLELLYARHMFLAFMWTIAPHLRDTEESTEVSRFDPRDEASWRSLQLHNAIISELANCVERAGLGNMEDAYLSIIPPLSATKILESDEVFRLARKAALEELSKENWEVAFQLHYKNFKTYILFGPRDQMAIKATALFVEFFRLLDRGWGLNSLGVEAEEAAMEALQEADGDVLHHLGTFYEQQGWPEFRRKLAQKDSSNILKFEEFSEFLGQTQLHRDLKCETTEELGNSRGKWDFNDLVARDFFGRSILYYWAYKRLDGDSDWFRFFLKSMHRKGMINTVDCYGMTLLHAVADAGHDEHIALLVGYDVPIDGLFQSRTALHIATERGNANVVRKLIDANADATIKTPEGHTALHIAVLKNPLDDESVSILLELDIFHITNNSGRTALHLAAMNSDLNEKLSRGRRSTGRWVSDLIQKLGTRGKNATDKWRKTALHLAIETRNPDMIKVLLEAGVEVNVRDIYGFSALNRALDLGSGGWREEVVDMLKAKGAENLC